ncbi:nitrous oxidase accessory protein NosD/nitrous oxide reductase accessory protein NosL [Halorubrum alkaliphilum]|uniref:Nitrous oxidase accessory protein NosD/nitrous oxide reductase accessory protein NosL n=1 Tax=Halorubrum alkaliphilum TaxID=261290 RepID=A0A8T4GCB8_9EURY|nr:nitrous oxidase accessory protein NosD/nitrous oxide reductase accessory protein NosL [Halorubrum alkaliphilum]
MLRIDPFGDRSRLAGWIVAVAVLVAVLVAGGAFLADPAASTPDPVAYDDTVELGLSAETDAEMSSDATVPRVQVFYSQFQYVVGYHGVETFVDALADDRTERQLGFPVTVYVQTFDDADPHTIDEDRFAASEQPEWSPAEEAVYVVDGDVESTAGETLVPFADRGAAERFAASHDGHVVDWETLRDRSFDVDAADAVRLVAPERWAAADDRIRKSGDRIDRPESIIVGEDEPTVEAAVDAAEPNTTVRVPPGEYDETVVVDEPITIAGEDATIRGNGTGSVIEVRSPDVGIVGLSLSGTGNETRDPDAAGGPPDDGEDWDTNVQLGYGHGDAGIRAVDAPGLVVEDVRIDTDASGVLLRDGSDATLTGLHVRGADDWRDGFMGVVGMESQVTVDDSRFEDGRDGVYLHRADGSVVRNSTFLGTRYGAHLMYTADSLIADNVARDQLYGGITVMTRPSGNAIVGNDVRDSPAGIQASGTRTYIAYNTLANNGLGLSTSSRSSLYEHNVLLDNEEGARATTVVPSSRVAANDFVGNDDHAGAGAGPLRIWADGDRGNHWEGADAGFRAADRAYEPTSPVDAALHRDPAATTLAESPAARLLDHLIGTVPGARSGSIVDPVPVTDPHSPDRIEAVREGGGDPVHPDWRGDIDADENAQDDTND